MFAADTFIFAAYPINSMVCQYASNIPVLLFGCLTVWRLLTRQANAFHMTFAFACLTVFCQVYHLICQVELGTVPDILISLTVIVMLAALGLIALAYYSREFRSLFPKSYRTFSYSTVALVAVTALLVLLMPFVFVTLFMF